MAFVLFIGLGLSSGVAGVAWPSMRTTFSRPVSDLGVLLALGTVGYFVAGLATGRLIVRFGVGRVLVASLTIGGLSLIGYATAGSWPLLILFAAGSGFSGGAIDGSINAYVALHRDARTMNLVHAFFGIGATVGPIMIASLLARGLSWRAGYFALAGVQVLLIAVALTVVRQWPSVANENSVLPRARFGSSVATLLGLFVLYVGIEVAAGQWAYSVLTESRGMAEFAAGIWVAIYWGALTGGRLILGGIGTRIRPRTVLHASMVGAVLGSFGFWMDPAGLGVVGLAVLGFSLAGVFPILVALTPSWVGEDRAPIVIGYQIAAAAAGGATIPWLGGVLVNRGGLESIGPFLVAIALAMMAVHWIIDRASSESAADDQSRLEQSRSPFSRSTKDSNSSQL